MAATVLGRFVLVSTMAMAAGCGASGEYVCPDPVGKIIRDDCEVYRTRYETLKVELGAALGPAEVKAVLGQSALREPTQLLQVLAHRTMALCRDFNACRVAPLEYRRRREATDRVFTAVASIQRQLEQDLDQQSKAELVRKLVQVLDADQASMGQGDSGGGTPLPSPKPRQRKALYDSYAPWYDVKHLPPQPPSKKGFPQVVGAKFDVHYSQTSFKNKVWSYKPRVRYYLRGPMQPDDLATVHWGGRKTECKLGRRPTNDVLSVSCAAPDEIALTGTSFTAELTYQRATDEASAVIDRRTVPVLVGEVEKTRAKVKVFAIDRDPEARQGVVFFQPEGRTLPAEFEHPTLGVVLKLRKYKKATARCWVNGKVATPGLKSTRGGQLETFQDRPDWERTGPNSSRSVKDRFIEWRRYQFRLPFAQARGGTPLPDGVQPWPKPGDWRCVVSVEGEPVRELTFQVRSDGSLKPLARQTQQASASWLVQTKVIPNPIEVPLQ